MLCNDGDLRLAGSSVEGAGRLEICQGEEWGTVCDNNFDTVDASVACRQLGFSRFSEYNYYEHIHTYIVGCSESYNLVFVDPVLQPSSSFGPGMGSIFLDNVACTGTEENLIDCPSSTPTCTHDNEAGIMCNPRRE